MAAKYYRLRHDTVALLLKEIRSSQASISPRLREFAEVWASNSIGGLSPEAFLQPPSKNPPRLGLAFLRGAGAQFLLSLAERIFYGSPGQASFADGDEIFVGIIRRDNGMKRICGYVELVNRANFVFLKMGGPLRPEKSWLKPSVSKQAKIIVPFRIRDCALIASDLVAGWKLLLRLAKVLDEIVAPAALREKAEIFARYLVRGAAAAHWADSGRGAPAVVFPILRPDLAMFDRALRDRRIFTVHWLHGTVEHAYKFHGFSSLALALNPVDAGVCRTFGRYGRTAILPEARERPARRVPDRGSSVLLTNLLHPGHKLPLKVLEEALLNLLTICRQQGDTKLFWRPHPREKQAAGFASLKTRAKELGIETDESPTLAECLASHSFAICTASGVIGDALASGLLPAVWKGIWYEETGLWKDFPQGVLFDTADDLRQVRGFIEGPGSDGLYQELWERFHCGGQTMAAPGFFSQEAKVS